MPEYNLNTALPFFWALASVAMAFLAWRSHQWMFWWAFAFNQLCLLDLGFMAGRKAGVKT